MKNRFPLRLVLPFFFTLLILVQSCKHETEVQFFQNVIDNLCQHRSLDQFSVFANFSPDAFKDKGRDKINLLQRERKVFEFTSRMLALDFKHLGWTAKAITIHALNEAHFSGKENRCYEISIYDEGDFYALEGCCIEVEGKRYLSYLYWEMQTYRQEIVSLRELNGGYGPGMKK